VPLLLPFSIYKKKKTKPPQKQTTTHKKTQLHSDLVTLTAASFFLFMVRECLKNLSLCENIRDILLSVASRLGPVSSMHSYLLKQGGDHIHYFSAVDVLKTITQLLPSLCKNMYVKLLHVNATAWLLTQSLSSR